MGRALDVPCPQSLPGQGASRASLDRRRSDRWPAIQCRDGGHPDKSQKADPATRSHRHRCWSPVVHLCRLPSGVCKRHSFVLMAAGCPWHGDIRTDWTGPLLSGGPCPPRHRRAVVADGPDWLNVHHWCRPEVLGRRSQNTGDRHLHSQPERHYRCQPDDCLPGRCRCQHGPHHMIAFGGPSVWRIDLGTYSGPAGPPPAKLGLSTSRG